MIMSTITSYDDALDFLPTAKTSPKRPTFLDKIRLFTQAMREGHQAARRYRELTGRGVPHDKAARQVFGEIYATD
jgi:hypothetical protein